MPIRVLHRGTPPRGGWQNIAGKVWSLHWATGLVGIDAAHHRAYVSHASMQGTDDFELDEIALDTDTTTRWIATLPDARMRAFHPLTTTLESDLRRYASVVDATGPFVTRDRAFAMPHVVTSKDHIAYESDPDALMLADRDGKNAQRIGAHLTGAYEPLFSPDGRTLAFTGCRTRGLYALQLADVETRVSVEIPRITQPQPPVFSKDGRFVYAASRDDGCLWRVDVGTREAKAVHCTSTLHLIDMLEADDGASAILSGLRNDITDRDVHQYVWIDLRTGAVRRTIDVENAPLPNAALGSESVLVAASRGGFVVIDLARGTSVDVPRDPSEVLSFSNQWKNGHTLYALAQAHGETEPSYEILEIDARAILASHP